MSNISTSQVEDLILNSSEQVFEVIYDSKTKPGELRHMRCVHGVQYKNGKGLQGRKAEDHAKGLLTVFDIEARDKGIVGGWRRINLAGVRQVKINNTQFDVK